MINEKKNERQPDLGKNREIFEKHRLSFLEAMRIVDEDYAKTRPTVLDEQFNYEPMDVGFLVV